MTFNIWQNTEKKRYVQIQIYVITKLTHWNWRISFCWTFLLKIVFYRRKRIFDSVKCEWSTFSRTHIQQKFIRIKYQQRYHCYMYCVILYLCLNSNIFLWFEMPLPNQLYSRVFFYFQFFFFVCSFVLSLYISRHTFIANIFFPAIHDYFFHYYCLLLMVNATPKKKKLCHMKRVYKHFKYFFLICEYVKVIATRIS